MTNRFRSLVPACLLICSGIPQVQAQIWSRTYAPKTKADASSSGLRYPGYEIDSNYSIWLNLWAPLNTHGAIKDPASGHFYPMRAKINLWDRTSRSWDVTYDISGNMPLTSPFAFIKDGALSPAPSWFRGFPHLQTRPQNLYIYSGADKKLMVVWNCSATSPNWAATRFNGIIEVRCNRDNDPAKEFIIQIEVMRSQNGNDNPPDTWINGKRWAVDTFRTVSNSAGKVPVHTYTMEGSKVSANASRSISFDLFPFIAHAINSRFERTSWNHTVSVVNTGVEIGKCVLPSASSQLGKFSTSWYSSWVTNR
jgi:hypothetical protein